MLAQLTPRVALLIAFVVITQVIGASFLVKAEGFRQPLWTAACLATFGVSLFALSETIRQGVALSLVMPVLAALVPLATIAVAVLIFREQVSWMQIGLLSGACLLIGAAAAA